ncbi:MAG: hypothetical protein QM778_32665 [Myxococcales bacterium]
MGASASASTGEQDKGVVSLAHFPEWLLGQPAVQELGKRLWGSGNLTVAPGLPTQIEPGELSRWVRGDDMACQFVGVPQDGQQTACLLVPSSDAARWVDRVLGGEGRVGHVRELTEPESGVLAYALGRALHELWPRFQLSDLGRARPEPLSGYLGSCVVWPLALQTSLGTVDLRLLLSAPLVARVALETELVIELGD